MTRSPVTLSLPGGPLSASFLPELGMVACSLRHEDEELLAQRAGVAAYAERGSTFGLPLLYPWANRLGAWEYEAAGQRVVLRDDGVVHRDGATGLPSHGVNPARLPWTVRSRGQESGRAWLDAELEFPPSEELAAVFPFPHSARYQATIAASELSVRLTLEATGPEAVPVSFGFHPYLTLPGSDRSTWTVELPVRRRVQLDDRGIPKGDLDDLEPGALSGPLAQRAFDDSFDELERDGDGFARFIVGDTRRRVSVAFGPAFRVAQVYAPAGSPFICLEPMTAPVDALRSGRGLRFAHPGSPFTAEFRIGVTAVGGG